MSTGRNVSYNQFTTRFGADPSVKHGLLDRLGAVFGGEAVKTRHVTVDQMKAAMKDCVDRKDLKGARPAAAKDVTALLGRLKAAHERLEGLLDVVKSDGAGQLNFPKGTVKNVEALRDTVFARLEAMNPDNDRFNVGDGFAMGADGRMGVRAGPGLVRGFDGSIGPGTGK